MKVCLFEAYAYTMKTNWSNYLEFKSTKDFFFFSAEEMLSLTLFKTAGSGQQ